VCLYGATSALAEKNSIPLLTFGARGSGYISDANSVKSLREMQKEMDTVGIEPTTFHMLIR
jgi:hypothetical protein